MHRILYIFKIYFNVIILNCHYTFSMQNLLHITFYMFSFCFFYLFFEEIFLLSIFYNDIYVLDFPFKKNILLFYYHTIFNAWFTLHYFLNVFITFLCLNPVYFNLCKAFIFFYCYYKFKI